MAVIDVSRQRRSLLSDATVLDHLPVEILEIIKDQTAANVLDAVSEAALIPLLTERIFSHFETLSSDICARWILSSGDERRKLNIISALARILPFASYLSTFLEHSSQASDEPGNLPPLHLDLQDPATVLQRYDHAVSLQYLVALWRLINYDSKMFGRCISPEFAQTLFAHECKPIRYVAVRIFCNLLHSSDYKLDALIERHVGKDAALVADLDGVAVDYGFLTLHEHSRVTRVISIREQLTSNGELDIDIDALPQTLTPYVALYGDVLLPRPVGPTDNTSSLVLTPTTTANLERFSRMLQGADPILIHGLPGSGKTSIVHEVAKQLGMYSKMVTLHLNEQTDAKMLIGLYSTDSKPGSFQWRPGVLTTAVREGRWVLVEDLDRAPTEVLSTLLPLIERRELLIPSRGERIRAASSFRLFATLRTTRGMNGRESLPSIVGMRFWQSMHTQPLEEPEMEEVMLKTYPTLRKYVPGILAVYARLAKLGRDPALAAAGRGASDRQINMRDLLKWCQRLKQCLLTAGSVSGDEPISETTRDWMFMEALDCFVGNCANTETSKKLVYAIAEEMHLPIEKAEHYMAAYIPAIQENDVQWSIGRVHLRKQKSAGRVQKSRRPFASTAHARKLLEQIAVAVKLSEPVLLVGETGIGKTTVVQQLAESLGHKLIAVNLSQQSEVGDLLGGFKPVNVRTLAVPLKEEFEDLFAATGISASKNQKYFEQVGKCFAKGQWAKVAKLWKEAPRMFNKIVGDLERASAQQEEARNGDGQPAKRRKTQSKLQTLLDLRPRWDAFAKKLDQFEVQVSGGASSLAFTFMEGNLVKAVRNGDWVLLDEINLASPDTLESIADLLTDSGELPSILLSETGEIEKVVAHPNFRIFGAMNPATDVGKRDLPTGIRSRFTELYVRSPDGDLKDLLTIIKTYLGSSSAKNDQAADDIARLYLNTKRLAEEKRLVDGANEVPHFSLRTLTRVLSYVNTIAPSYGLRRALYEGFSMGFLTLLDRNSEEMLLPLIHHHIFENHGNSQSLLSQPPKHPNDGKEYVRFNNKNRDRQYWLFKGKEPLVERDDFIITPYVERNLLNLVRATSTRRFPILIQGPTSAGKTSMIEYLANFTGNKFVRINNHEHTDLQEYLGTYISDSSGKLRFQEGLLVQAMRQGHWIVLDELNLAPTDVLEALNRLLDDNRELLIPETQEVVRPHENFILFATQNPPGLYGGRKVLSRAFRNRFLELHFDDIPENELEFILQQRSRNTSPPDCRRIVTVYKELSRLRQTSRLFEQKDSFATLRDLFRWALRQADTREEIAIHGFMLLAERVRNEEERLAVKDVIEKVFKVKIDPLKLYSSDVAPELKHLTKQKNAQGVVWTHSMRRLYVLVSRALENSEPVLLVGETGCGKTTVVQLLAEALGKQLHIVNAHQNTETGDLIGSQRPIRNRGAILDALDADLKLALGTLGLDISTSAEDRLATYKSLPPSSVSSIPVELQLRIVSNETRSKALFEWSDGALVESMKEGHFFLLDEISLADDSVLERLNSVLEPQKTLLLAEKGTEDSFITAVDGFQMFATMNPGGDFGKKELSPALRNRFTEIWVPSLSESEDIYNIVRTKLVDEAKDLAEVMVQFASWFGGAFRSTASSSFSIREILVWVQFVNTFHAQDLMAALVHGAATIFIDSIGANPSAIIASDAESVSQQRDRCLQQLSKLAQHDVAAIYQREPQLVTGEDFISIGDFSVPKSSAGSADPGFAFHALTTRLNGMRVLRALQMQKPILLEGSPGVGKTTLVAALARACGQPLTRINLSDQTDLMDLFGTDVPVEGAEAGNFAWRDAPFLQAMQKGEWVLLDEMNLASQSVLEGLNACLDHRGEVYISELDQVFKRHPNFRLFAAQNPHHQGGGRKGLPSSFVNRFVVVYADVFSDDDLQLIAAHNFPGVPSEDINHLIQFVSRIEHALAKEKSFGAQGSPWEFNLRDVLRWLNLLSSSEDLLQNTRIDDFLDIIVRQRFRTQKDRDEVDRLFSEVTGAMPRPHSLYHKLSPLVGQVGLALLERNTDRQPERLPAIDMKSRLPELETLMICVKKNIPCILSSPSGYGKTVLLEHVAALAGKSLVVFPMNADIDAMDLVGGFEQADPLREVNAALVSLRDVLQETVMLAVPNEVPAEALKLLYLLDRFVLQASAIAELCTSIEALVQTVAPDSEIGQSLSAALRLLQGPLTLDNPRFEWLDGVIVKALQAGQWLVLDNANMCNASVLDRLNSLLEPNGFLSINEHCEPNGEPRIIKPHPDFRIFLTVDPRYGELSRAMRNRAVEIFITTAPPSVSPFFEKISRVESSIQGFSSFQNPSQVQTFEQAPNQLTKISIDHLAMEELALLQRFAADTKDSTILQFLGFLQSPYGSASVNAISSVYQALPEGLSFLQHVQPIHPLSSFIATTTTVDQEHFRWLGARYEFAQDIHQLATDIESRGRRAQGLKLGALNRLERSLISDRVAAVSKDSTVHVSRFLSGVLSLIADYLGSGPSASEHWKDGSCITTLVICYLERTILLASSAIFDEARFQAHLLQGNDLLQRFSPHKAAETEQQFVDRVLGLISTDFGPGFKLATGLSMELLWTVFRPLPFHDESRLEGALEVKELANRFDSLRWKAPAVIKDLCKASSTLEKAYGVIQEGAMPTDDLVAALKSEIQSLEDRIGLDARDLTPFFADIFETLRQVDILSKADDFKVIQHANRDIILLSNLPTEVGMLMETSKDQAALLQSLNVLASQDHYSWNGKFTTSLWSKISDIPSVPLASLALLELELPILAQNLTRLVASIVSDPVIKLNRVLWQLLLEILGAHSASARTLADLAYQKALELSQANAAWRNLDWSTVGVFTDLVRSVEASHVQEIISTHFLPAIVAMAASEANSQERHTLSALAWNHFSIGALLLYVPDRVFDPQIRPQMEREFFEKIHTDLDAKITVLHSFEKEFTGQDTNARIERLQEEANKIGPLPEAVQPVFRPAQSELSKLHAEFSNILNTIQAIDLPPKLATSESDFMHQYETMQTVRENIQRLISRLSSRFESYQDMTVPTISLLRCLIVGLSLCEVTSSKDLPDTTQNLLKVVPFLGGTISDLKYSSVSANSFEFLDLMSLVVSINGTANLPEYLRESIFDCFHHFYKNWAQKLEADQKAEAEKTSMYRFRGSAEDEEEIEEEEFNELFPTFDEDASAQKATQKTEVVRDESLKAAKAHSALFLSPVAPPEAISGLCLSVGQRVAKETRDHSYLSPDLNGKLMASTILYLDQKKDILLSSTVDSKSYNFYVSENLPEVRTLVSLCGKVKARFRELQQIDEIGHMQPLVDVIQACDKLLDNVHTEPLAKILPKIEYLHGFVYEWQFGGWASKAWSVLELHNAITDTIIRWRRLELSTWANLFEMERSKCEDDAKSWWFIAYQVVVATPLTMIDSPSELQAYAVSLVENLELYIATSIIGQFSSRLGLLRQLRNHLKLLAKDYPNLAVIHNTMVNLIRFFERFEPLAEEAIKRGRAPIDKKMKDVLLLASWKDTNITALRESARKSHQKLFRLVRKFRGVLGQEMKSVIEQGLPDIAAQDATAINGVLSNEAFDASALASLSKHLPDSWLKDNKRLANTATTVSVMTRVSDSPELASDLPATLDSFVASLNESMAELRKETPGTLTDENKEQVKHLKTRKRKLFADTLKELRQMGVRYNLSQDRLAEQESLAICLASSAPIDFEASETAEYFFHKVLDLAPQVRKSSREHSEEVTSNEVTRGIGFVEGFIHLLLSQRHNVTTVTTAWSSLHGAINRLQGISRSDNDRSIVPNTKRSNWRQALGWLVEILSFSIQLIEIHGKLGESKNAAAIQELQSWLSRFASHNSILKTLATPLDRVTTTALQDVETNFSMDLQLFMGALDQLIAANPNLGFILDEVRLWSQIEETELEPTTSSLDLKEFVNWISTLCDKTLVAVEAARKSGKEILRGDQEPGWLTKHSDGFGSMIKRFRMSEIEAGIEQCLDLLSRLDLGQPQISVAAKAAINLLLPILERFSSLCRQSVDRFLDIHRATGHMALHLTKSFAQIAAKGFCTPQEKSEETAKSGKLESGTGLGEGEGAEDISKDIQDDEDLTELAQEPNKEKNEEMEDEKDAVDMADDELEGDLGSVGGDEDEEEGSKKGDEEEDDEDDMDEETGDVDDLDPTAVDEKMWDGENEDEAEKDQEGDKGEGQKQDDEQMAADDDKKQKNEGEPEPEESKNNDEEPDPEDVEGEHEDAKPQEELNKQEQTAQENDALALPDEMDLDFDDPDAMSSDSDDLDLASDTEEPVQEEAQPDDQIDDGEDEGKDVQEEQGDAPEQDENEEKEDEEEVEGAGDEIQEDPVEMEEEKQEEDQAEDEADNQAPKPDEAATADKDNVAPSDVKSSGLDDEGDAMDLDEEFQDKAAQDDGEKGQAKADENAAAGTQGSVSKDKEPPQNQEENNEDDEATESAASNPFRKLGDALEKWHRQQDDIKDAGPEDGEEKQTNQPDADQGRKEFQHLQHDDSAADAQAMGTAKEEEVQPIDESMAIDEEKQDPQSRVMEEDEDEPANDEKPDQIEQDEQAGPQDNKTTDQEDTRSGVKTRQGNFNREQTPVEEEEQKLAENEDEMMEETSTQLSTTHISDGQRDLRDFGECMQQWVDFQSKTHTLSLSLTSQLRLILTPSQSTKLSGSFRTGKRLNIKRIIPYIASSYKRDKIWMRRSVPTKRTYQILLCVDDSKSMGETASGTLAMESLVMVSRSLTMLEAGQVGVVGFGGEVFTAHELTDPFAADAGAKVLQNFTFSQDRTDIALLIRQTIDKFRAARQSGGNSDLWQLSLILSDGLTPSSAHDSIRRLLREAIEERIMIVFIIMDDTGKKKGDSVLELKEAKFVKEGGESRVVIERYLDTFPFQYYLIVHHLEELPSALAGLLRTWFSEVTA
ncbi:unnamed protein product [Clonostachys byssicola]|uniref:Midasin n=1 Tax=Clonostachys byssicola TaxID=160290 RepID=A0A9N9XVA4_9HYPO|nr:unnamed protein product [Clonostachys byssicola]